MDGIPMEPVGKYRPDRNGSAKAAAWRNMVDQDLDDVAFLAESEKRGARLREAPVAVCSQRRALCLAALVLGAMFATALLVVYATPQPDCPCLEETSLVPGHPPTEEDPATSNANKERIATNGALFPWRGARLPTFLIPKHYNLWLHPNLTTGELRGEVSIEFKVDKDTIFVVLNARDMNITERALFKSGGGALGPKIAKTLEYPPADQTYIEFKEKLRRKYNYTLSLRFLTKLDRSDKQRGFFLAGTHRHRCAVSRFWLTHARSAFPCLDEPHFRATFKLTIVRDRFHVSLTNMPIVATEEAGFYLGHRLLQDEFATSPPMSPHMMAMAVCRLQRRAAPPLATDTPYEEATSTASEATTFSDGSTDLPDEQMPPPEISLYSDQQVILDESGPLLEWVSRTIQQFSYELNTSYPLPKLDIVVVEGGSPYAEGWGLITLAPGTLSDTKTIARLLAQQWFGGLVSPRWWSSQWLLEALTSVLGERAPPLGEVGAEKQEDALLLHHMLPALRLDSSSAARAIASPRLERADIESAVDELSIHKGAAIVSMAILASGIEAGRAALSRLLRTHRAASADARDLWRALHRPGKAPPHAWDGWCERPGYPIVAAVSAYPDVVLSQERFVMSAEPPNPEPAMMTSLLTMPLRTDLEEVFYEPENYTEPLEDDINSTTTTPMTTTTTRRIIVKTTKAPPQPKWVIPITFTVGPLEDDEDLENITRVWPKNGTENLIHNNGTWYDVTNDTKVGSRSRWAENVTHLIWMNDTELVIPDLGRHKWVRYNIGARGLYRVAPQDPAANESTESAARRTSAQYVGAAPAERALLLDDAFVLSRAGRLPASRALAAAVEASELTQRACPCGKGNTVHLKKERHWAPWRVVLTHLSWWRELLRDTAAGPHLQNFLAVLHPTVQVYNAKEIASGKLNEDELWLSGALLSSGVEWGNPRVTKQALALYDAWSKKNQTIPELYQEAAFTAGVRTHGEEAWSGCWSALVRSYAAPRPLYSHRALLAALAAPSDDWLFYRFAWTALSPESRRNREWKLWWQSLGSAACRWRGADAAWRLLRTLPAQPQPAVRCLYQPGDYYQLKELFSDYRGLQAVLDTVALNAAWVARAEPDLLRYFTGQRR